MEPGNNGEIGSTQPVVETARFDQARRLWQSAEVEAALVAADIEVSIAHVRALGDGAAVPKEIARQVVAALETIMSQAARGEQILQPGDADFQTGIERRVYEIAGINADVLRLGRTDTERVATAIRVWMSTACAQIAKMMLDLRRTLLTLAERDCEAVMPGYVHMQPGVPVLLADWWMANEARITRDFARLMDALSRICVLPQGASSQTSQSGLQIDRTLVARYLGFCGIVENGIDAVSDRDYIVEFASCAASIGMHISQMSSDLLLWSTHEYGFVRLPRSFVFRTQMMPPRRNVELLEILRSRPSILNGRLIEFLNELKGLSLSFNQDLQEALPGLLDVIDNCKFILELATALLPALRFDMTRMRELANADLSNAGNAVDFLIDRDVVPDKATKIAEALIAYCKERNKQLSDMTLNEWVQFSPAFNEEIFQFLQNSSVEQRYFAHGAESLRASQAVQFALSVLERDTQAMTNLAAKRLNCREQQAFKG